MSLPFTFTAVADAHMRRKRLTLRDMLGDIPFWLSAVHDGGAVDQIDRMYGPIGGGWRDSTGFQLDVERGLLSYPSDDPLRLIASAELRTERILIFDGSWVAVVQPDGSSRVARID